MCSIARRAALGFDAAAFLDRRRGVVAAAAPAARGVMAREPVRGVGATQKRSRDDFDGKIGVRKAFAAGERSVVPAPGQQRLLQERMRAELDAIRGLHRKAVLLCRGAGGRGGAGEGEGARVSAAGSRSEAPMEVAAAKRVKTSPSKLAPVAAPKSTEPVMKQQQEKRPVQRATPPPPPTKQLVDKAREVLKRRRLEEMAQAREKCRQEVLEMERTALPDETIYAEDLKELGIAFQYAVTRTRSQAARSRLNGGE